MSARYLFTCLPNRLLIRATFESVIGQRLLHLTPIRTTFWERDRKGGYNRDLPRKFWKKDVILSGLEELKGEIKLWKEEVTEKLRSDPVLIFRPGEIDVVWSFKQELDFKKWVLTTDSDHLEGESKATFELSKDGHGLFQGNLSEKVPLDGRIKRAGYCNIKSMRQRKSFKRDTYHDWTQYNMLRMRVRGDGRSYLINIASEGEYDVLWNDVYHYVLYTRGGPYWQDVKVSGMGGGGGLHVIQVTLTFVFPPFSFRSPSQSSSSRARAACRTDSTRSPWTMSPESGSQPELRE